MTRSPSLAKTENSDATRRPRTVAGDVSAPAAITKLVSDRDVLLSAMTTLSTAQQSVLLLEYVHGFARAAIQKVNK